MRIGLLCPLGREFSQFSTAVPPSTTRSGVLQRLRSTHSMFPPAGLMADGRLPVSRRRSLATALTSHMPRLSAIPALEGAVTGRGGGPGHGDCFCLKRRQAGPSVFPLKLKVFLQSCQRRWPTASANEAFPRMPRGLTRPDEGSGEYGRPVAPPRPHTPKFWPQKIRCQCTPVAIASRREN